MKQDFLNLQQKINGKDLVYLDNAATTQKPEQVIKVISNFYEKNNANVHRGIHELSNRATEEYENARKTVAKFINAEPEETIFTKGTTDSLNMLTRSLKSQLKEGDEIVLSILEHHANIVPWQQLAKEKKLSIKYLPLKDFQIDLEEAKKIITKKTKIVSISHISNVLGTIAPIEELEKLTHKHNAYFIIDAAQSAPHSLVDVKKQNPDFLVFSGHKMFGPTGVGILYGKKQHLEKLEPSTFGGSMIKTVTKESSTWADLPQKFEAGTANIAQAIGLAEAITYLQKQKSNDKELTEYALTKLKEIPQLKIIGPEKNRIAIFSFTVKGIHPHDLAELLNREGIAIRAGHHCTMPLHKELNLNATARASFYYYNTKEDIDKLVQGIKKALEVFK